jgi:hypothetical protein
MIKPGLVMHVYSSSYSEAKAGGVLKPRSLRTAWATQWDPLSRRKGKVQIIKLFLTDRKKKRSKRDTSVGLRHSEVQELNKEEEAAGE